MGRPELRSCQKKVLDARGMAARRAEPNGDEIRCAENNGSGAKNCNVSYQEACVKLCYGRKIKNSKQADKYKSTGN